MGVFFKTANSRISLRNNIFTFLIARVLKRRFKDTGDILKVRHGFDSLPYPKPEFFTARFPDLEIGQDRIDSVPVEWVNPGRPTPKQVVMYLHGGGYMMGSINSHRIMTVRIARRCNVKTLSVQYRLAPEHPFPAALEDSIAVYRWLIRKYPATQIVIAGDSAGGGLTLATLLKLKELKLPMPAGAMCFSAWTDLSVSGNSISENRSRDKIIGEAPIPHWAKTYLNGHTSSDPLASPMFGEYHGLPPLLMQASTSEVLRDDTLRVAEIAKRSGVKVDLKMWKGTQHVWQAFPSSVPEVNQAFEHMNQFLDDIFPNRLTTHH